MPCTPATEDCVSAVRHAAIWQAGFSAGNLRRAGHTPHGHGKPAEHGAFQWWDACGFGSHERERSTFTQAFLSALT